MLPLQFCLHNIFVSYQTSKRLWLFKLQDHVINKLMENVSIKTIFVKKIRTPSASEPGPNWGQWFLPHLLFTASFYYLTRSNYPDPFIFVQVVTIPIVSFNEQTDLSSRPQPRTLNLGPTRAIFLANIFTLTITNMLDLICHVNHFISISIPFCLYYYLCLIDHCRGCDVLNCRIILCLDCWKMSQKQPSLSNIALGTSTQFPLLDHLTTLIKFSRAYIPQI